jgi:hypothetical protein
MKKISLFVAIAGLLVSTSCQKTPEACLNAERAVVVGEEVSFESCSKDADKVEWDFGDGNIVAGNTVNYTFEKEGTYLVNMTAYSRNENKTDRASTLVTVGNRYVTKIQVTSYPLTKSNGDAWDAGISTPTIPGLPGGGFEITPSTGPDIAISFSLANGDFVYRTFNMADVSPSMLPFSWDVKGANLALTNASWQIRMVDVDGEGFETMAVWTANPSTLVGEGSFTLTNTSNPTGNAVVVISYEVR